ncbi:unnamed protein product [Gordionus sp. m RMFG-2023]
MLIASFAILNVYLLCTSIPALNSNLETTHLGEINQKLTFQLLNSLQDINAGHKNDILITKQKNMIFSPFNIVFTRDDGELEKVKMMHSTNKVQYGETQLKKIEDKPSFAPDQKIKIISIQYANPNLAMFFVLPEQKGLPNLIKDTLMHITLPVFKTSLYVTLSETLKNLGLRNIFEGSSDFFGLTGPHNSSGLCISEIFHKAVIEVNEKGTEAAAATGVVMIKLSLPITKSFKADRPFLYFVQDLTNGHILFIGTYIKGQCGMK